MKAYVIAFLLAIPSAAATGTFNGNAALAALALATISYVIIRKRK